MAGGYLPYGLAPSGELTAYTPTLRERASDWLRQKLFTDDRAGQDKANRLMDVANVTPFGFAMDAYDAGRAGGRGDYLTAGTIAAMSALPGPAPERKGIRAFHGSPHSFDRFDMSKIGTGEGAQAYGHGLYFAEQEGIARGYRDALKPGKGVGPEDTASRILDMHNGDTEAAIASLRDTINRANANNAPYAEVRALMDAKNILVSNPQRASGSMYEVNINADPNTFLDWDKPLSEQPQNVRDWFDSRGITPGFAGNQSGAELMMAERSLLGPEGAMVAMRDANIPGIKYLDHGSRFNAMDGIAPPTQTRNYVVFDDKLISIVRKYGIAGASAMLGYNILNGMDDAQAAELKRIENSK